VDTLENGFLVDARVSQNELHSADLQRSSIKLPLLCSQPGGVHLSEGPVRTELRRPQCGKYTNIKTSFPASTPA